MVITCDDLIFNEFQMSNYPLVSGNGSDGVIDTTDDMSLAPTATTVFVGDKMSSQYVSHKYEAANEFTVRFAKANCQINDTDTFTENELRTYNRLLTGKKGYSWLKIVNKSAMETDYYYRAIVSKIEYERLGYDIVGYDVTFLCDGGMAYSEEQTITVAAKADIPFYIFSNSDDLYGYMLPTVKIKTSTAGTLTLTNSTDSWSSTIDNMNANETVTFDCKNELLTSSRTRTYILNDFNLHWPRILPGKNEYVCNMNATITFTFRANRKVGFVT
jgi:hypothetical protein